MAIGRGPQHVHMWAKYNQETKETHPLICHMIDCGNAAASIWDFVFTDPLKARFTRLFQQDLEGTKRTIKMIAALHDIGKATMAFQSSVPDLYLDLKQRGFSFTKRNHYTPLRHDLLSAWCFLEITEKCDGYQIHHEDAHLIASVLGGHHGSYQSPAELNSEHQTLNLADASWQEMRSNLRDDLLEIIKPPSTITLSGTMEEKQAGMIILSGMIVSADWISSDAAFFPFHPVDDQITLNDYYTISEERAREALTLTGWNSWQPDKDTIPFEKMFQFAPNSLQTIMIDLEKEMDHPFLTLIEAPTGQGKTEAAFYLCDRKMQEEALRGLYIAMPTMATSNQMYERTKAFLDRRYPDDLINLQLAHSQARWMDTTRSNEPGAIGQDAQEDDEHVTAKGWFLPGKKTLLAPFGVGTVDQSLMSVLRTKHFYLRLFGLAHKVVIFDEIHAYDMYMSTLFLRLLAWLRLLETSVIILSATLPTSVKRDIVRTFCGKNLEDQAARRYPSVTSVDPEQIITVEIHGNPEQRYLLQYLSQQPDEIIDTLTTQLADGGCAAVITNTVKEAQRLYQSIQHAGLIDMDAEDETLLLFHARFPLTWRNPIEQQVLSLFGKDGKRPRKAVLIATQVIEQSLDLDFDVMISDLAPIDLLIQRAGRLHRHPRTRRPDKLVEAFLYIRLPESGTPPDFGVSKYIYDEEILYATYLALDRRSQLLLPRETRALIEQVYDPYLRKSFTPEAEIALRKLAEKRQVEADSNQRSALQKLIPRPGDEELLMLGRMELEEENPEIHRAFQAMTRLIPPSVSLICLQNKEGNLSTLDGTLPVDVWERPSKALESDLLQSMVNVSNRFLFAHFFQSDRAPGWKRSARLRHCIPVPFTNGAHVIDDTHTLILDKELGLHLKEDL